MIFTSNKLSTVFKKHLHKYAEQGLPYKGANRRATRLLPEPMINSEIVPKNSFRNDFRNLLLNLEAKQQTGCLLIESEKNKARAGILMYRGRILGCMRGQKMADYSFGNQAYEKALDDLGNTSRTNVYPLKEELVAAAGAMFHGQMKEQPEIPAKQFFQQAVTELKESNMPGCIVVRDKMDGSTCIVYIFHGHIVGVHLNKKGWLQPDAGAVNKFLDNCKKPHVQYCFLPCHDIAEISGYSFSLSGLADRADSHAQPMSKFYVPNVFTLQRLDEERLKAGEAAVKTNKFIPGATSNTYGNSYSLLRGNK